MEPTHLSALVLPLSDPDATLDNVGGKGMSLAKLRSAGLPVPDGFHVTTEAYRRFVALNGIQPRILEQLAGIDAADTDALEAAAGHIGELFAAGETPPDIADAISAAYGELKGAPVAVRSSATAEDLPGASFAGQQETYLNIRGTEAVLQAVKKCWASLWTARAIAYRTKQAIDQHTVALAVVVQQLVAADAAGVMFTANPVTGARDELVINAAWGLGEAVVSGAVTPDTITVDKASGNVLRRETAEKSLMTVRTEAGTREVDVPEPRKKQAVLTDAQAAELVRLGTRIETLYGMPMDVEWTLAGGAFSIVQARPITALPPEWKMPDPKVFYSRGSLAEHTPGPVTPLFATLGLELANQATGRMWQSIIGSNAAKVLPAGGAYQPINGYVYLGYHLSGRNLLNILKAAVPNFRIMVSGTVERWQAASKALDGVVKEWEQQPVEALTPAQLLQGVRSIFGAACTYFTEIQSTLPAAATSEVLFTSVYDRLIKRRQDPPATTFMFGFDTASLEADKSLFDIAAWMRTKPAMANYIFQRTTEQLEADLKQEQASASLDAEDWAEWRSRFQQHMEVHARTAYEFDFASPTPNETPGPMLDSIKAYLASSGDDPYRRQREAVDKRERATHAVLSRVGRARRALFTKLLRWAQHTGPMREDSIFDLGMGHPLVRRMLAELGRRFVEGGAIRHADEIYWLDQSEVEALVADLELGRPLPDFSERVPARKIEWQAMHKLMPPLSLPERTRWSIFFHGAESETRDGKTVLKGVGTSGGTATAPACVVLGPEDFSKLERGDVLVAVTTTPAWTPLFALASAVVTDIGGPLSHSSIVAREYGIPAVMAARSATRAIHSGQLVTVDGNTGTVTLDPGT